MIMRYGLPPERPEVRRQQQQNVVAVLEKGRAIVEKEKLAKKKGRFAMKVEVTLKDPDGFSESVDEDVKKSLADLGLDDDELEPLVEKRAEKVREFMSKWVEHGEYVTIVFDTEAGTATVQEVRR